LVRDAQIAANFVERREIREPVNEPVAAWTNAAKEALRWRFRDVVHHVASGPLRRFARETVDFARAELLLAWQLRLQMVAQIAPVNEMRALGRNEGKAVLDPSAYGVRMHAQKPSGFRDDVALMDFDTAEVVPPRHASPAVFDERANVFHPPNRYARAELHRLGESAILDASPPRRAANGNRSPWREYRAKAKEAGLGEMRSGCALAFAFTFIEMSHIRLFFVSLCRRASCSIFLTMIEQLG
jgi:hypothetical protein